MTVLTNAGPDNHEAPVADGRRQRSRSSRSRIAAAMLELVGNGDYAPSAARVAEVAGVGLRSVFRHFEDMDALYREMAETIESWVLPIIMDTPKGEDWTEKLADIADRRAKVYETILPYRISANLKRFQSPFLMQGYKRMVRLEGETIDAHLPAHIKADAHGALGIKVILGFQTWRQLRHDMGLSVEEARAVVRRMLDDALAALTDR